MSLSSRITNITKLLLDHAVRVPSGQLARCREGTQTAWSSSYHLSDCSINIKDAWRRVPNEMKLILNPIDFLKNKLFNAVLFNSILFYSIKFNQRELNTFI